uniref:Probable metalloprotease ARX1 n=1 Tax=Blastobotrys adeninivorans TaxID=409370 RepID=A0A060T8A8_BLAAD
MEIELADQKVLLDDKNVLNASVLEKYRLAGQIAQTGLVFVQTLVHENEEAERSVGEICRLGDAFLRRATGNAFKKQNVKERGIALPVQIEKTNFVSGVAPEEEDSFQGGRLNEGDIVKITLGVHIDGYTAQASHTTVVRSRESDLSAPNGPQPLTGTNADAVCAAYIASEAVICLLGLCLNPNAPLAAASTGSVNGRMIRQLVEKIAATFRVKVCPGSRVRRVRRFLAGQNDLVQEADYKGVDWIQEKEEQRTMARLRHSSPDGEEPSNEVAIAEDDFQVEAGEAWLVDIRMAGTQGKQGIIRFKDYYDDSGTVARAAVYSRDYGVQYGLKLSASRSLLSKSAAITSVYPFKLSYVAETPSELASSRLGLSELVHHHIFVPHSIKTAEFVPLELFANTTNPTSKEIRQATQRVDIAREMSTVVLASGEQTTSGFPEVVRLTGGNRSAPAPWVHSAYEITDATIRELLDMRSNKKVHGIGFQDLQPSKINMTEAIAPIVVDNTMEVD